MLGPSGWNSQWSSSRPIKITKVKKRMDTLNSLVMKIFILSWVEDGNIFSVFIGYKDFHPNHHRRMESSSSPIDSWKEKRPLIGMRDFHKLSLAKGKQAQGRVLWVACWIYDIFLVLKERDLWFGEEFWQERGVTLRGGNVTIKQSFSSLKIISRSPNFKNEFS